MYMETWAWTCNISSFEQRTGIWHAAVACRPTLHVHMCSCIVIHQLPMAGSLIHSSSSLLASATPSVTMGRPEAEAVHAPGSSERALHLERSVPVIGASSGRHRGIIGASSPSGPHRGAIRARWEERVGCASRAAVRTRASCVRASGVHAEARVQQSRLVLSDSHGLGHERAMPCLSSSSGGGAARVG